MDPTERLERLATAGVELVVVEHFDDSVRQTPYDAFVAGISDRCRLVGIVMTPDSAFGHDREGTPGTVAELGAREGFEVIVVPPFALDGREVRSSDIRAAISLGDLAAAERLLGRPYAIVGQQVGDTIRPAMPVALPPPGAWPASIGPDRGPRTLHVSEGGVLRLEPPSPSRSTPDTLRVELGAAEHS
ncbi:MAG: hypothetical protein NVS9B8_12150 [Candidatus Limnocylindrales bacterium]